MKIPQQTIDEIFQRADIVDVARAFHLELKKAGDNTFKACCPFHNEKTPSFHINVSKQVYHCFGCGVGGGIIKLVQGLVNTDFVGAVTWLANRYNIAIPEADDFANGPEYAQKRKFRDDGMRLLDEAAGFFQSVLSSPEGELAREYLANRGIDDETIQKYRLGLAPEGWDTLTNWAKTRGYSPELLNATGLVIAKEERPDHIYDRFRHRIMFPICDELSRVVAFSGRLFDPNSQEKGGKYVNSPESEFFHKGKILYGFHLARQTFKQAGWALVCEGQLDVIACHRAGLGQAFASQGTAFTEDHARMLARTGVPAVHLAFDGDAAGFKATMRTLRLLLGVNLNVEITVIPDGEDPDSLFRRGGPHALQQVMSVSTPAIPYAFQILCSQHPEGTPEARSAIVNEMLEILSAIPDEVVSYGHCQELARQLSLPENVVADLLAKRKRDELEATRRANQYGKPQQLPPPPQENTIQTALFHDLHGVEALAETMLDLCVHFEPIAMEWQDLNLGEVMTAETPLVRALNTVLAGTAAGDWLGTVENLAQSNLSEDSSVSKILTVSPFAGCSLAEDGSLPPLLEQAVLDCQNRLETLKMEQQQQQLTAQLQNGNDVDADAELLRQAAELSRRRSALKTKPI